MQLTVDSDYYWKMETVIEVIRAILEMAKSGMALQDSNGKPYGIFERLKEALEELDKG